MASDLSQLAVQCTSLPTQPFVAETLLTLAGDPDLDAHTLSEIVCLDPALSARLLRFVNSPLYAPRIPIETVHRAIIVMGLQTSLNIALDFRFGPGISLQYQGLDYGLFWSRCLLAARSAQELAKAGDTVNANEVWLPALLQDVGMLAIDQVMGEAFYRDLDVPQADHPGVSRYEKSILGCDHASIGTRLLRRWGLSERFIQAVGLSHDSYTIPDNAQSQLIRHIRVGAAIADAFQAGTFCAGRTPGWLVNVVSSDQSWSRSRVERVLNTVAEVLTGFQSQPILQGAVSASPDDLMSRAAMLLEKRRAVIRPDSSDSPLPGEFRALTTGIDQTTGSVTKKGFQRRLAIMLDEVKTNHEELSLVFLHLLDLNNVRGLLGQPVADRVAKMIIACLEQNLRAGDILARYGDSSFVLALQGADEFCAVGVIDRTGRMLDEKTGSINGGNSLKLSYSFSRVTHGEGQYFESAEALIEAGLNAAYRERLSDEVGSVELLRSLGDSACP